MKKMKYVGWSLLLTAVLTSAVSAAENVNQQRFRDLLGRALDTLTESYRRGNSALTGEGGKMAHEAQNYIAEPVNIGASGGAWRLRMTGIYMPGGYGATMVFTQPVAGVIANYGDHFEYLFQSQPVDERYLEKMDKELEDIKEDLIDEDKDLKVTWERKGNVYNVYARYDYASDGVGEIEDYSRFLMRKSKELSSLIIQYQLEFDGDRRGELEDMALTKLIRKDFELLLKDTSWSKFYQGTDQAKEGYYLFNWKKVPVGFYNHGDKVEFVVRETLPADMTAEQKEQLFAKMTAYVKEEGGPGKPEVSVFWADSGKKNLWIRYAYALDGSIEGDDLVDIYDDLYEDTTEETHDKFGDISDDVMGKSSFF